MADATDLRLVDARDGEPVRITSMSMDPQTTTWLGAIGLGVGERVVVLRRALFSGPLHVRTDTGAELAVGHALSKDIHVERVSDE
mgnify:CR=1 FL=1